MIDIKNVADGADIIVNGYALVKDYLEKNKKFMEE